MITPEEVIKLHELSIQFFGGSSGIRDLDLLESAVARPFQTFESEELYTSVYEKSAALLESIIKNHPFVDGNKRTGFLAAFVFLRKNNISITAPEDEAYEFVVDLASSKISFEEIVAWLKQSTQKSA